MRKSSLIHIALFLMAAVMVLSPLPESRAYSAEPSGWETEKLDVAAVLEGKQSAMTVYSDGQNKCTKTFRKHHARRGAAEECANLTASFSGYVGTFTIYQVPQTRDYYLAGLCLEPGEGSSVADAQGSEFYVMDSEHGCFVFAALEEVPREYWVEINGERMEFPGARMRKGLTGGRKRR